MVERLRRSKMGVSPVVASLLLVFITVVASTLVLTTTFQWIELQRVSGMQVIKERLIIEDAWFRPDDNTVITLVVTNVGEVDLKIRYILVNGVELWESSGGGLVSVGKGGSVEMNVSLGSPWIRDERYVITVITDRGNRFEAVFWSPS